MTDLSNADLPSGPLTPAEVAGLRKGVDITASQELVDSMPQARGLLLAMLHESEDHGLVFDALDELNRREGLPPVDRQVPDLEPSPVRSHAPDGLSFLPQPFLSFEFDFGGDHRLQQLFNRAQGFPPSDA